jgi:hypothetical protein
VVESDAEPGSLDVRGRDSRACPVPDNRLLGGLPMDKFPGLAKKQGISRIQPLLRKSVSKTSVIPGICER